MDFLSVVCSDHHNNFHALLGVKPVHNKRKPKATGKNLSKRKTIQKPIRRYKLPSNQKITKKKQQPNRNKNEKNTSEVQTDKETDNVEQIKTIETIKTEPNVKETIEESVDIMEIVEDNNQNDSHSRAQKNFFHIVLNQTASNLKRFLRTNKSQVDINQTISDKKLEKKGGPFCGWGAIHVAAFRGDIEMISLLLDNGADINLKASLQSEVRIIVTFKIFMSKN